MTAAVLSIGTELTRGELVNTNATWLSEQLIALGFTVGEHLTVADEEESLVRAIQELLGRHEVVIATGGLGPTDDDLTAVTAAQALREEVVRDDQALAELRRAYENRGLPFTEGRMKMADRPKSASVIPNPTGTAPGFCVEQSGKVAFFLPGVPREMKRMFDETVVPAISARSERSANQVHVRVFGMGEASIADRIRDLHERPDVTIAYRVEFPEVELKILATNGSPAECESRARDVAREIKNRLGQAAYGEREDSFPAIVGEQLRSAGLTLAVAESCTGGMVGSMLTEAPGASDYFLASLVTYSNAAKTSLLNVSTDTLRGFGAVSAETAGAMAKGAKRSAGSDIAVAITGIAGPGGGTEAKPVGTVWFGLAKGDELYTVRHQLRGGRERIRLHAAYIALDLVRQAATSRSPARGFGVGLFRSK